MVLEVKTNVSHMSNLSDIQKKVLNIVNQNIDEKTSPYVSIDSVFSEVDSITFIKIVVALEIELKFDFDDEMLLITKFPTLKSIVEYIESKISK